MRELGREAEGDVRLYFTGGATAVLLGWRTSTIDVDIKMEPAVRPAPPCPPRIKDKLEVNIELAAPDQFIPEIPGWKERSPFIAREGRLSFYHYDFYAQALSKIQRGHAQDLADVREMMARGLVDRQELSGASNRSSRTFTGIRRSTRFRSGRPSRSWPGPRSEEATLVPRKPRT